MSLLGENRVRIGLGLACLLLLSSHFAPGPSAFALADQCASGLALLLAGLCLYISLSKIISRSLFLGLTLVMALQALALTYAAHEPDRFGQFAAGFWLRAIALWLASWMLIEEIVATKARIKSNAFMRNILPPALFGLSLLLFWEWLCIGLAVPAVILPAPSQIAAKFDHSLNILAIDFTRTFLVEVLIGWIVGSLSGFLVAVVADRFTFLRRGLLPLGSFISALPLIGIAPIMVAWFGNDWQPMAAVVTLVTFFPMLINTGAGLAATSLLEQDLMRSYGASYGHTFFYLRLPAAMPFIFNGLKMNSTLAMIGAIVAEYFGRQTFGMGFRINTEAALSNMDLVWSEITVAALTGSLFYGALTLIERKITFWHPSYRNG